MKTVEINDGETIFEKGQESGFVYIIKSGEVKVIYEEFEEVLMQNEIIGIEALLREPYMETAIAKNKVKLTQLSPEEFKELYSGTDVEKKALKSFTKRTMKILGWI
ncbi:cyclic nucleotide-binding protein [Thermosipho melanesiensis]|uniref:Cyclic nucleotide-binding protein n=2 Tax=Thermosipho melanesiensis TaxID=46541 RepID=A6LKK3_THEM4|nr:cyclic nucleotide-binding domain-containing protein [Thermosipho melanesiensis]ABR30454.1 cyclic nucleotide-binding protein [Thermosipho melanesiensis BI429]APT73614.1 cyclic nucleotide-binding protein [Thermosipho melanesiensis]OOC37561.1 cyclic nucleotide-binding protein [Thermosipho melanesiensis]OOC39457.1 cyclic nucleotide-binding protein [Thermosipho melanesiensis]OOC39520.1 cyclic nucleotide-binding protein [Thermosipho melanesiensis]